MARRRGRAPDGLDRLSRPRRDRRLGGVHRADLLRDPDRGGVAGLGPVPSRRPGDTLREPVGSGLCLYPSAGFSTRYHDSADGSSVTSTPSAMNAAGGRSRAAVSTSSCMTGQW
ncbi:hypothetical protein BJF78_15200 [Pseudonocardia sp. CNS-139]|nr:hypothetical protein BJF78_15200 [Pseudonocardia sp. CNS-139]